MPTPASTRRALLATIVVFLSATCLAAGTATAAGGPARAVAAEAVADLTPAVTVPRVAYVTGTSTSKVWLASASGGEAKLLGPGQEPLLAPDGQLVAASLFGVSPGVEEHGPALGLYSASGAPIVDYLNLETSTASPLAWSADSRYLAVELQSTQIVNGKVASSLDVIDTQTQTVTQIANGTIYGASFAHDGSDKLVFGLSHSESFAGGVNLYVSEVGGTGPVCNRAGVCHSSLRRLTSDGHSLNPIWGPRYIAYDREHSRKLSPEYQIWLASPSGGAPVRRVTHISVDALAQGLVPLAFSASGNRLVAQFEGQDQSGAYAVNVITGRAREVTVHGRAVVGAGISSDGSTLLIDENALFEPPSKARVATIPFAGGRSHVIVAHGSQASWNR
jgi:Tol biopolymer transport system component